MLFSKWALLTKRTSARTLYLSKIGPDKGSVLPSIGKIHKISETIPYDEAVKSGLVFDVLIHIVLEVVYVFF